jgi:dTMP kinase
VSAAGRFITLEGPEGGGKSTQAARLAARLRAAGREVLATREPGGTPLGEAIRRLLQHEEAGEGMRSEAELFLFLASRAQLVREVIRPALARGTWVVCDRFADSTTAYQGFGRGCDLDTVLAFNAFALGGLEPDLTLLLDLDITLGFERLLARHQAGGVGHDRIERADRAFHERLRQGYLELARRWPGRFRVLNAALPADVLETAIWETVCRELRP